MAVHRIQELTDKTDVFADRSEAGRTLGRLLAELSPTEPIVLAIPAGGVPVAVEVAKANGWPLDVAVVSKITLPWNTEAGYGAVAYDGSVRLNDRLIAQVELDRATIDEGIAKTRAKVERRKKRLRGGDGMPDVKGCTAILVDDGLASGFTIEVAIAAVRQQGAALVIVAVPTGHSEAVQRIARQADEVVCANVRAGVPFAVADAYHRWSDIPEVVADELLRKFDQPS